MIRLPHAFTAAAGLAVATLAACSDPEAALKPDPVIPHAEVVIRAGKPVPDIEGEGYFRNVRQLTFGGDNGEAYWSGDGKKLIWQARGGPTGQECDQIYIMNVETGEKRMVSSGKGRTTCAYFLQGDDRIIYASTHLGSLKCPPAVWRTRQEIRLGHLQVLRHLHGEDRRFGPQADHQHAGLRTPKRPSARSAAQSCSRRCATGTSSSTRWSQTAATSSD